MPLYPLFGGAITVSLDGDYLDASDMRQVPDNQEVLLSRTTNAVSYTHLTLPTKRIV